ncbi:hypothetical protein SAMN02982929_06184 [Saccharopolyspora kobensis]|uniref:Uncharacterized protein n=1 Tax=Saccharopolyspora kobensis TaxID=146035 RepID=A0A1H6EEV6_9PSEU|nr:hypothetical protein [Saccharopolyspora kobensis]SEG95394.1 hypothetical protein SAMN02982929_06184 [Saccharopolyspora kobensis]SFD56788.1 hypothetical protein SAMN05216506_105102 [Saccharopolyspora kobensis]
MRGQFFGDLLMVLITPLVGVLIAALLAVVLSQSWGLHYLLPGAGY